MEQNLEALQTQEKGKTMERGKRIWSKSCYYWWLAQEICEIEERCSARA